ncbi:hypothetical protein F8568_038700 [Actinomadura sp. LD22]|uniref:Uncharacterized protein n=1 Tax=Actinomadura physcomitrii TaxID=2650748 RepID=A0A6I4MS38_9ACTN|nr:hypothetical protein [Actinomadura physcomitrii]MWA06181.1 hypothetical protein [Actinomadura physcomitrii]
MGAEVRGPTQFQWHHDLEPEQRSVPATEVALVLVDHWEIGALPLKQNVEFAHEKRAIGADAPSLLKQVA